MRHVVIEGPDGAGKTRLARHLARVIGLDYRHEGPPPPGVRPFEHYMDILRELEYPTVLDRFHLGEVVYGPLLRGTAGLSPTEVSTINQRLEELDFLVIGCLPSWETCLLSTRSKDELIKDETMLRAAYDGWKVLFATQAFTGRLYDYTKEGRDAA